MYNVHGLTHLATEAKQHGTLDNISSFPFENYLKNLKKMVRKPSFLLSQVIRRLSEKHTIKLEEKKYEFKEEHNSGPVPLDFLVDKQFFYIKAKNQHFRANERDCYIRIRDEVAKIVNFLVCDDDVYVVFRLFNKLRPFFSIPFDSQLLGIHIVSDLRNATSVAKFSAIQAKCILFPHIGNEYIVIPMTDNVW